MCESSALSDSEQEGRPSASLLSSRPFRQRGLGHERPMRAVVPLLPALHLSLSSLSLSLASLSSFRFRSLTIRPADPASHMPPRPCQLCGAPRAILKRPKTAQNVCKACFFHVFEEEIHNTIVEARLFKRGDRVAIGASGGKGESSIHTAGGRMETEQRALLSDTPAGLPDSTVLAHIMKTLNDRYDYGLDLFLLSIDEGITGYRDDSLEVGVCARLLPSNAPLMTRSFCRIQPTLTDGEAESAAIRPPTQDPELRRTLWVDHGPDRRHRRPEEQL